MILRPLLRNSERVLNRGLAEKAFESSASTKESELKKFQGAAWWNRNGAYGTLHRFNPARCRMIRDAAMAHFRKNETCDARFPLQGKSVLDVGCGGGILTESLGRLGGQVLGIDVIQQNIETAQKHLQYDLRLKPKISYKECKEKNL